MRPSTRIPDTLKLLRQRPCTLRNQRMSGSALSKPGGLWTNLLVAGALAAFVGGTYWKVLSNVSSDDLERELEREIAEEERRQRKAEAAAAAKA